MRSNFTHQPPPPLEEDYEPYDYYYDELIGEERKEDKRDAKAQEELDIPPTQLFPTRREVAQRNQECLASLGGRTVRILLHLRERNLPRFISMCTKP